VISFTPLPLYPGERAPGTHWIGGWVDPRAYLDLVENRKFLTLPGLQLRPRGRPARKPVAITTELSRLLGKAVFDNIWTSLFVSCVWLLRTFLFKYTEWWIEFYDSQGHGPYLNINRYFTGYKLPLVYWWIFRCIWEFKCSVKLLIHLQQPRSHSLTLTISCFVAIDKNGVNASFLSCSFGTCDRVCSISYWIILISSICNGEVIEREWYNIWRECYIVF
jgi:hypothetical protein